MQATHCNGEHPEDANDGSSQNQYFPPPLLPANAPGWLSHLSALPQGDLPRAPTSFAFSTSLSTNDASTSGSPPTSSTFNEFLQHHHPAYTPPDTLYPDPSLQFIASPSRSAHSDVDASLDQSLRPSSLLSQSSILRPPEHTSSTFSPWHSSIGTSRLPLIPQDVEYEHHSSFQQPVLSASSLVWANHLDDPPLDHSNHAVPTVENGGTPVTENTQELAEDGVQTASTESGRKRKRKDGDTPQDGNNIPVEQQRPRPKKSRKSRSQATENIDPQLDDPLHYENEKPSRSRKEPRNRGRPKGQKVGPRPTLDPGPEFMALYNQAMDAFIEQDDPLTAQTKVLQAIAVNPEIFAAHSLLADIHFAKGDHDKGLDALISGLHAHMNDVELWRQVADTILAGSQEMPQKRIERAMYCFGAILRKEPMDMDARFQRAECARLLGHVNRAFSDLNILLQDDPHNSSVLAQFTKLCSDVNDASKAKLMYDDHFEYYKVNGISEDDCFTWQDIEIYVDLIAQAGEHAQAIIVLKSLSRWLCGRRDEDFWEEYLEDDREFDQNHYPRRLEVSQFEPNVYPEQDYGEALPLDLRAKLGILRLKLNYHEEARSHFDWLEPDLEEEDSLVEEYSDTFLEIAKALYDAKEHKEALRFYDALKDTGMELSFEFWIGLGASAYVCDQRQKAIKAYERALIVNPDSIEARTQLAKLYRDLGDRPNALKYGREAVIMSQDAIPQTGNRKYENKENRLLREAAERALKGAYRLPTGPRGAPGKVPDSLKYRTRLKSKFLKYVPRDTEEPSSEPSKEQDDSVRYANGRLKKFGPSKRPGRPSKPAKPPKLPKVSKPVENVQVDVQAEESTSPAEAAVVVPERDEPRSIPKDSEPSKKSTQRQYRKQTSKIDPQKRYEDVRSLYQNLLKYQPAMREGDEEATSQWMSCAQAMVDDFRTVKVFFPGERHSKFRGFVATTPGRPPSAKPDHERQSIVPDQSAQAIDPETPPATNHSGSTIRMVDEGVPNDYCGIPFPTWLDIFLELALVTANYPIFQSGPRDLQTDCYTIINAAIDCNVFYHHSPSLTQIYIVYLSCCLALNDDVTLFNTVLRWFMNEFTFCTDTYRLYSTVALLGEYSNAEGKSRVEGSRYRDSSNQKFLFRQLCSIDQQLPKDYGIGTSYGPVPAFMRRERDGLRAQKGKKGDEQPSDKTAAQSQTADVGASKTPDTIARQVNSGSDGGPVTVPRRDRLGNPIGIRTFSPKEMDVVLFILYSHIMMANNSFTNALNYLYRAHSLDPSNTVCLLSMAFCYLTELFKRQVGNRHALSLMGWMWFGKYESERRKWATQIDEQNDDHNDHEDSSAVLSGRPKMLDIVNREIEFNRARCWEMLGMPDLAVRGYKTVLTLPRPEKEKAQNDTSVDEYDEEEPETWDMEAAYAMSTIYMINGDGQMAREIVEKYMVVE